MISWIKFKYKYVIDTRRSPTVDIYTDQVQKLYYKKWSPEQST